MALIPHRRQVPVKGMNTVVPIREMSADFAPLIKNAWFEDGVQLKRRPAQISFTGDTLPAGYTAKRIHEHGGLTVRTYMSATDGATDMGIFEDTGTAITKRTSFADLSAIVRTSTLKGTSVWGNAVDTPKYSNDGITFTNITSLPTAPASTVLGNIFINHKGRCWAAGDPANPMTIFISDAMTSAGVTYWDSVISAGKQGGILDISADLARPDPIKGLAVHRDFLVVLCSAQILFYTVTDPIATSGITLFKLVDGEGLISHDTIHGVGEDVMFLSPNGFKNLQKSLIQGDSEVNDISQPINNEVKNQLRDTGTVINDITAAYNASYGLYTCRIANVEWAYQVQFRAWFKWVYLVHGPMFTTNTLYSVVADDQLYKLDTTAYYDKATTAISMEWSPSPIKPQQIDANSRWNKFECVYQSPASDSLTVEFYLDDDVSPVTTQTLALTPDIDLGGGDFTGRVETPILGRSEMLTTKLINNSNSDFRITLTEVYENTGNVR